jgi:hypothetical protein
MEILRTVGSTHLNMKLFIIKTPMDRSFGTFIIGGHAQWVKPNVTKYFEPMALSKKAHPHKTA